MNSEPFRTRLDRKPFYTDRIEPTLEKAPRFSLIVPAYNEAARIGATVAAYLDVFQDSEVIVVINGSTDETERIVLEIAVHRTNLHIIHIEHAVGKGGAVRAGFIAARAAIVGYVDADGATAPLEIRRLFELLGDADDAIIASRWSRGSNVLVAQPMLRRISSRTFNAIVRIIFRMPFVDTQCGAKVFKAAAIREIAHGLEVSNFAFDIDVLYHLQRAGKRVIEVPTTWRDVSGSRVELPKASREMLIAIFRLRLRHSIFRYIIPVFDRLWPTKPLRMRGKMSVLFLNWRDPRHPQAGGAEKFLLEVGKGLIARGHTVHWLTAGFPGATPRDVIDGIEITRVGGRMSVYARIPIAYVRKFRDRFDAIVDAENGIPFFSPLYSFKPKVCLVHHVHQRVFEKHLPFPLSTIFKWLEGKAMPRIYRDVAFLAVSNDTKDELGTLGVSPHKISVVYNGVENRATTAARAEKPTIAYVGRLKPYKRVELLLEAVAVLRERIPEIRLVIAGTGESDAALRARVLTLGIDAHVTFEGFVSEDRKHEIMANAWVFAMPSEMEGWGLTVIEANACGTPAAGFPVPGVREAIVDGTSGLLVADGETIDIALARILTDRELRARLQAGARARAAEFSWDRTTRGVLDALSKAISRDHMSYVVEEDIWAVIPHERAITTTRP